MPTPALHDFGRIILVARGTNVILDSDLAKLYGVTTKSLNQAVKRNYERFPATFMFPLKREELAEMRSQIVTASYQRNVRFLPYAFTEHVIRPLLAPPPETPRKKIGFRPDSD